MRHFRRTQQSVARRWLRQFPRFTACATPQSPTRVMRSAALRLSRSSTALPTGFLSCTTHRTPKVMESWKLPENTFDLPSDTVRTSKAETSADRPILSTQMTASAVAVASTFPSHAVCSTVQEAPPKSFYRRSLPNTGVPFSSLEGKHLFREALLAGTMETFFSLAEQFRTQDEPAYCGLTTLTIILNALEIDPYRTWKGVWRWYHEAMLDCCVPLQHVQQHGLTFSQFICLAECNGIQFDLVKRVGWQPPEAREALAIPQGHSSINPESLPDTRGFPVAVPSRRLFSAMAVETIRPMSGNHHPQEGHAFETKAVCSPASPSVPPSILSSGPFSDPESFYKSSDFEQEVQTFRQVVKEVCGNSSSTAPKRFLVVSYERKALGQTSSGHFSPIGGYHEERDLVLIMDVVSLLCARYHKVCEPYLLVSASQARFKYPPHWVGLKDLVRAMSAIDGMTGIPRGYGVMRKVTGISQADIITPFQIELPPRAGAVSIFPDFYALYQSKLQLLDAWLQTLPCSYASACDYLNKAFGQFIRAVAESQNMRTLCSTARPTLFDSAPIWKTTDQAEKTTPLDSDTGAIDPHIVTSNSSISSSPTTELPVAEFFVSFALRMVERSLPSAPSKPKQVIAQLEACHWFPALASEFHNAVNTGILLNLDIEAFHFDGQGPLPPSTALVPNQRELLGAKGWSFLHKALCTRDPHCPRLFSSSPRSFVLRSMDSVPKHRSLSVNCSFSGSSFNEQCHPSSDTESHPASGRPSSSPFPASPWTTCSVSPAIASRPHQSTRTFLNAVLLLREILCHIQEFYCLGQAQSLEQHLSADANNSLEINNPPHVSTN